MFLSSGFSDSEPAASALPHTEQELARAAEAYQEYLTPHNVCMFVIIKEFLLLYHGNGSSVSSDGGCGSLNSSQVAPASASVSMATMDTGCADASAVSNSASQADGMARTPEERFELYNFILDQLDEAQLFPMEALMSRGRAVMKPALAKQVDNRMRQFFIKRQAKETRSPFHALETYLSYAALNALFRDPNGGGVGLSPGSVCGTFLRKVVYAFQSRSFAQAYEFVGRLRMYYYGCLDANDTFACPDEYRRRQSEETELESLGLLEANRFRPEDEPDAWQLDRRHAEAFAADQAFLLAHNPAAAASPLELEQRLARLCCLHPSLEALQFLRYLNAVRRRDRTGAERHLRAYFGLRGDRAGGGGCGSGAHDVMALAAMLQYLGFRSEAQIPLREATLHCLSQGDAASDRARSAAEAALARPDVRRLLSGGTPLRNGYHI